MDAVPGLPCETRAAALRTASRAHRSARRASMPGWPTKPLLVALALVVVLGLIQGTRTALRAPHAPAAPEVASPPPAREADWRRGHFYRPAGSTASRPRLVLRPLVWRPAPGVPALVASACTGRAHWSC
jgi:hypothetical protein